VAPAHPDRIADSHLNLVVAGGHNVHPVEHNEDNGTAGHEDVVSYPSPWVLHLQRT
jgi:hypothetical protein